MTRERGPSGRLRAEIVAGADELLQLVEALEREGIEPQLASSGGRWYVDVTYRGSLSSQLLRRFVAVLRAAAPPEREVLLQFMRRVYRVAGPRRDMALRTGGGETGE